MELMAKVFGLCKELGLVFNMRKCVKGPVVVEILTTNLKISEEFPFFTSLVCSKHF
jgi:hypothetical protein